MNNGQSVLVFGATGQQGGSVARALLHRGWRVRALVRDPFSAGAVALAARGAELVVGTFEDRAAMRSAMAGVDGVFSVQPSSPGGTVTDEQEVRYGITIADLAVECGVKHLVYSSGSAAACFSCARYRFQPGVRVVLPLTVNTAPPHSSVTAVSA